ncbi:MAG: DUF1570 domain-containing protein [Planctomycetota bacterium]
MGIARGVCTATWLLFAALLVAGGPRVSAQQPSNAGEADAMRPAREAERAGRFDEAFDGYLEAWHDPTFRVDAARRARAIERIGRFSLGDDEEALEQLRRELGPGFAAYRSKAFVVLSNADDAWTRTRVTLLERARAQYFREMDRLGIPVHPHRTRLVCVIFATHDEYVRHARERDGFDAGWAAGYYGSERNVIVMYDDRSSPQLADAIQELAIHEGRVDELRLQATDAERAGGFDKARMLRNAAAELDDQIRDERTRIERAIGDFGVAKAIHEAIHLLAFNTGLQSRQRSYPVWVSEGLASSFETASVNAAFGFMHPYEPRDRDLADAVLTGTLPAFRELVALETTQGVHAAGARPIYAASYGLFRELYRTNRAQLQRYLIALADQPRGRLSPAQHVELFERHFGAVEALERRLLRRWSVWAEQQQ